MRGKILAGALTTLLLLSGIGWARKPNKPEPQPPAIALHEAEILIYLLPVSKQLRGKGLEVGWELIDRPGLNHEDYYNFTVFPEEGEGMTSAAVGDYAVNKHTADLWDRKTQEIILTEETEGVQRILRKAHAIDEEVIRRYRLRRLDSPWALTRRGGGQLLISPGSSGHPGPGRKLEAFL